MNQPGPIALQAFIIVSSEKIKKAIGYTYHVGGNFEYNIRDIKDTEELVVIVTCHVKVFF